MGKTDSTALSSFLRKAAWQRLADKLSLSPREVQIVRLILQNKRESAIARRLLMSLHTVHMHTMRLHRKLSVQSRPALIVKILTTFLLMTAEPDSPLPAICGIRTSGRCPLKN
jgi:DNA-binding CsgD family transcriptional regulator